MTQMQFDRIMKAQPALGDKYPVGVEKYSGHCAEAIK